MNGWPSECTWATAKTNADRCGSAGERPEESEDEDSGSATSSVESDYAEGRPWQVLLGVPISGGLPNWDWHDMGYLHFGIRRTDLAERRFDRAVLDVDMY